MRYKGSEKVLEGFLWCIKKFHRISGGFKIRNRGLTKTFSGISGALHGVHGAFKEVSEAFGGF